MPLYMDIHQMPEGTTHEQIEKAHIADLEAQEKHGVRYLKYWFNQEAGTAFCFFDSPTKDAAIAVHTEAHGLMADQIIEVEEVVMNGFLGGIQTTPHGGAILQGHGEPVLDGGFRTILFTDMEGSTSLMNRLGDEKAMEILLAHKKTIRDALAAHRGRELKHTGDGIMASFVSASDAVGAAIQVQRELAKSSTDLNAPVRVRIGVNAGEPIADSHQLFGAAVNLAARICDFAEPCQVLVSGVVKDLCMGKGFEFDDGGTINLKGFDEPVRVHTVTW